MHRLAEGGQPQLQLSLLLCVEYGWTGWWPHASVIRCAGEVLAKPQCLGIRPGPMVLSLLSKGSSLLPRLVFSLWVALVRTHTRLLSSLAWLK